LREAAAAVGGHVDLEICTICPYVDLRAGRAAHEQAMGRKLRTDVRRRRRLLEEVGPVTVERRRRVDAELLGELQRVNRAHFAVKGLQNLEKSDAKKAYVRGIVDFLAGAGLLEVAVLRAGGRAVAYHLGYC